MVAQSCPRNEADAVERIKNACQRKGLAEAAEYVYERGGEEVTGPTIDLLTVIANNWGNIEFGFRELSQTDGESHVESFAWDLETNTKKVITFTVRHIRYSKKKGLQRLTDPRDIYEVTASSAQRRVRKCLEDIIPPDVVDDAVKECRATLEVDAVVNDETVGKLLMAFHKFDIKREHLEKRLGRRLESMQPAQLVRLRAIFKSLSDNMSEVGDWFEMDVQPAGKQDTPPAAKTAADAAKEALRQKTPATPPVSTTTQNAAQGHAQTTETANQPATKAEPKQETKPAETEKPTPTKAAPSSSSKQRVLPEALTGYIQNRWEAHAPKFNIPLLAKDAAESTSDPYGFIDSIISGSRAGWAIYLAPEENADEPETLLPPGDNKSSTPDETSQLGDDEDPINSGMPEYVTDGAVKPSDFCEIAVSMEKTIIGKRNAEIIRQYAQQEVKGHPDLHADEIAYLMDLANRRAWQLENNVPTTDRLPK